MTLWVGAHHSKSPPCQVSCQWRLWQWRYNVFSLSRGLERPRNQIVFSFNVSKLLVVCNHPSKFGDHRHCCSGDIMILVFEEQDSSWQLNPSLQLISIANNVKHILIKSYIGHTCLEQQQEKNIEATFVSLSRFIAEKKKGKKKKTQAVGKRYALIR